MKTRTSFNGEFVEQFSQECQAWIRELEFLLMEVSFLKTRLSHAVDASSRSNIIKEAEVFQSNFIYTEDMCRRLLAEVKFQSEQVEFLKGIQDEKHQKKVRSSQGYLRTALAKIGEEFSEIRKNFNKWVLSYIHAS